MAGNKCPNINLDSWKELVDKLGIFEAYKAFRENDGEIPDPSDYGKASSLSNKDLYYQLGTSEVEQADRELDQFLLNYLKPYGVKVKDIEELKKKFDIKDALGIADVLNKVIYLSKNNRKIDTMAEEAAHIITMLMGRDHPLFRQIFDNIERHSTFNEVYREYMPVYNNLEQVKKETVDKLIAEAIVNEWKVKDTEGKKNWLQKFIDAVKKWWDNFINKNQTFTEYVADKKVSPTAVIIAEKIFSRDESLINKVEGKEQLDYNKALSGNEHAKNTVNLFTDYFGFRLTGSLAIAGQGEGINRPSESPIHDLDFVVSKDFDIEKMDAYMKNLGAIPTHSGIFSKTSRGDVSSTYAYLVPAEGYSVEAAHRKTSKYWTEFADEVILRNSKGKEIYRGKWDDAPSDKLLNVDFFDNYEKNEEISGKYKNWQDIYFGKMVLSNLGDKARMFPRAKDQVDYIEHTPVQRNEIRPEFLYYQKQSSSEAPSAKLDKIVKGFLKKAGVSVKNIPDGDFAGKADTINKIIEVVDGKAGIDTLGHEATHMFLDMLPDDSPILKEIMDDVTTRPEYEEVYEQYKDDPEYHNEDGSIDEEKMAKEAASHIIDDIIVGKFKEKAALKWWQKLWKWVVSKFKGKEKLDAYQQVAEDILSEDISKLDLDKVGKGKYKQLTEEEIRQNKINARNKKLNELSRKKAREHADSEAASPQQKAFIEGLYLKESISEESKALIESMGLRPTPKVDMDDNHIYTDENGIVYNSTTKKITGEFSAEKAKLYEPNKDIGNDIDALMQAAAIGISFADMEKMYVDTLSDDQKKMIYTECVNLIGTLRENGKIVLPQMIVSDPVSKTAGSIDLTVIDQDGSSQIYDLKTSTKSVDGGEADTYNSMWEQNPGSVFNGLFYDKESGQLVPRKEGKDPVRLSKKLQHGIQTGSYGRMVELQGSPVSGLYSYHIQVEIGPDKKLGKYTKDSLVSHNLRDNKSYIDQVVPTQVLEENWSQLQKEYEGIEEPQADNKQQEGAQNTTNEEAPDAFNTLPTSKVLSEKVQEFVGQRIEYLKRAVVGKPASYIVGTEEFANLDNLQIAIATGMKEGNYSALLNRYMEYTINQAKNMMKFINNEKLKDGKLNPVYPDVINTAWSFLEGYRNINDMVDMVSADQIDKFKLSVGVLNELEDAIEKGIIDYLTTDAIGRGTQYTKDEIKEAFEGGAKDISALMRLMVGPSGTPSVLVSLAFDNIRQAMFSAVEASREDKIRIDKALDAAKKLLPNETDQQISERFINKDQMTFVNRVGEDYTRMKQSALDDLTNPDTEERYEYVVPITEEDIEFNKDLHSKIQAYTEITQAEEFISPDYDPVTNTYTPGYYDPAEYCEYAPVHEYNTDGTIKRTLDYVQARNYFERPGSSGRYEERWSVAPAKDLLWTKEKGKYYATKDGEKVRPLTEDEVHAVETLKYRNEYKVRIDDKYTLLYDKTGTFNGKVVANPEGTTKWVVQGKFKQVKNKSLTGKDLRDPKYVAIMEDNSPKGMAIRDLYNAIMDVRHLLSLKLPENQRKTFMKYLDATPKDDLWKAVRDGDLKKARELAGKKLARYNVPSSKPTREVSVDEKGDIIRGVPSPTSGRYSEKNIKELKDKIKVVDDQLNNPSVTGGAREKLVAEKKQLNKKLKREQGKTKVQDIDTNIIRSTKEKAEAIHTYDQVSKAESGILALKRIADSHSKNKQVALTDADNKNVMVNTVKAMGDVMKAMFGGRGGVTNISLRIEDMLTMLMYKDDAYKDSAGAQVEGLAANLISLRFFFFNPPVAFAGRQASRFLTTLPEAIVGEYFNKADMLRFERILVQAQLEWVKDKPSRLAGNKKPSSSKMEAWIKEMQLTPGSHIDERTVQTSPQYLSEWLQVGAYAGPIALNTPVKGKDGTISNMWDIYKFNPNTGMLEIDPNFEDVVENDKMRYKLHTKVIDFQNRFEGYFDPLEKLSITQFPGGRSLALFKKHVPSIIQRLWQAPWVHMNLGYSEGSWRTGLSLIKQMRSYEGSLWKKMRSGWKDIVPKGAVGNKDYYKLTPEERKKADEKAYSEDKNFVNSDGSLNKEKVERDRQKRSTQLFNMKRNLVQITSVIIFFAAYQLFKAIAQGNDGEVRRWNNFLARTFDKLRKQQLFGMPLVGLEEQYQLIKSPIASLRVIGDFADTLNDTLGLAVPGVNSRYTTGVHAGEIKALVKAGKMVPIVNLEPWWEELNNPRFFIK